MATSTEHSDTCDTPRQGPSDLISEATLTREITALAKATLRRDRLACNSNTLTLNDLISEGWLASQRALAKFDPEKGELLHYLRTSVKRDLDDVVRAASSGSLNASARTVKRHRRGELDGQTSATLTAITYRSGIAVGSAPGPDEGEPEQGMVYETDMNVTTDERSAEDIVIQREQAELIHLLVDELEETNPLNARVVRLRFGLEDGIVYSVEETATIMGTGTKNVERRYTAAMKTLRQLTEPLNLSAG